MEPNTPSELLTRLLDGELESAEESGVYRNLAVSEDLQKQMQEQLAIRHAVRRDTEAFTPPAEATAAVFASLGYTPPGGASLIKNSGTIWKRILKRVAVPAMILLLASLSTVYLINNSHGGQISNKADARLTMQKPNSDAPPAMNHANSAGTDNHTSLSTSDNSAPVLRSVHLNNGHATIQKVLQHDEKIVTATSSENLTQAPTAEEQLYKPEDIAFSEMNKSNNEVNISGSNTLSNPMMKQSGSLTANKIVTFYIKSSFSPNRQAYNVSGSESLLPVEGVFGTYINIKNGFSGGIEIGYQSFMRLKNDNQFKRYEINQNVVWVTANFRYDLNLDIAGFTPFIQGGPGVSQLGGLMYRGTAGFDYNISPMMGLTFGYEYSKINNYKLQNYDGTTDQLSTSRGAINAGILLRF